MHTTFFRKQSISRSTEGPNERVAGKGEIPPLFRIARPRPALPEGERGAITCPP